METVLLESSFRAAVMIAAMAAVLVLFRVRSGAARHAAWSAVLLTMLLLPVWAAWGPELPLRVLPAGPQQTEDVPSPDVTQASPARAIAPAVTTPIAVESPSPSWSWREPALSLYALVTLGMLTRLLIGTMRARKIAQHATLSGGILTSPQCAAPVTVGWLKPVIVLPAHWTSWTRQQQEAVLLHEQEHVRRRDSLIQWLALLNGCIFWFHPLAWWLERRLNLLAEEACDDAVLGRGHSPQDYSMFLIDVARAVQHSGARVTMSFAYRDRTLKHRVQRILKATPAAALTRGRAALVTMATAAILVVSTACTLDRPEERAAGEPTMGEMRKRRADQSEEVEARRKAMQAEVNAMTSSQAQELEAQLKSNPDDRDAYYKMVRYYQRIVDVQKLDTLHLWLYEHAPESKVYALSINHQWNGTDYGRGKKIWLAHLEKPTPGAEIYRRAARYFTGNDKPLAEQTLLNAQKAYPSENWSGPLGDLYSDALAGAVGGRSTENVPRGYSETEANGPFAQSVRAKLEATNDPNLLVQAAHGYVRFLGGSRVGNPQAAAAIELSRHFINRALSIEPNHLPARSLKVQLDDNSAAMKVRNVPTEELTVNERMIALRVKLNGPYKDAEPAARELLKLAADNPTEPEYGNAIFFANQLLGEAVLKRNDKKEALQFLRASMEAPPTDRLRYGSVTMNLAGHLVDWGERTAVAEFLEHCAKFSQMTKSYDYGGWATQIRAGKNPELFPYHYRGE